MSEAGRGETKVEAPMKVQNLHNPPEKVAGDTSEGVVVLRIPLVENLVEGHIDSAGPRMTDNIDRTQEKLALEEAHEKTAGSRAYHEAGKLRSHLLVLRSSLVATSSSLETDSGVLLCYQLRRSPVGQGPPP